MNQPCDKLFAALVQAQQRINPVHKDSRNEYHRYNYASAEDVIDEGRKALNQAGLALVAEEWRTQKGDGQSDGHTYSLSVRYRLVHASGQSMNFWTETSVIPEKGRPNDKAEATALTYNLSYFLRGLLLIPRTDEEQVDQRDDRNFKPPAKGQVPQKQKQISSPGPQDTLDLIAKANKAHPELLKEAKEIYVKENGKDPSREDDESMREVLATYQTLVRERMAS